MDLVGNIPPRPRPRPSPLGPYAMVLRHISKKIIEEKTVGIFLFWIYDKCDNKRIFGSINCLNRED